MRMKLSNLQAIGILEGVNAIVKGGPAGPYRLDAVTVMRIRMTQKSLSVIRDEFFTAKNEVVARYSGGKGVVNTGEPGFEDCKKEIDELAADEHEVEVFKLEAQKLLERNDTFPIPVLEMLDLILIMPTIEEPAEPTPAPARPQRKKR